VNYVCVCVTELAGKSDLDNARIDMIVDCLDDATKPFFYPAFVMNPDADAKVADLFFAIASVCSACTTPSVRLFVDLLRNKSCNESTRSKSNR